MKNYIKVAVSPFYNGRGWTDSLTGIVFNPKSSIYAIRIDLDKYEDLRGIANSIRLNNLLLLEGTLDSDGEITKESVNPQELTKQQFDEVIEQLAGTGDFEELEAQLRKEIAEKESENSTLTEENAALEKEKTTLTEANTSLTEERDNLANEKSTLEGKVSTLEGEKATLTQEKAALTEERDGLATKVTTLEDRVTDLEAQLAALEGDAEDEEAETYAFGLEKSLDDHTVKELEKVAEDNNIELTKTKKGDIIKELQEKE